MSRFLPLTVTDIRKTIRDAVVLTLEPAAESREKFAFVQGQYLTFRRDFDGRELRRNYSVCTGQDEGVLQVGIKRVDGGAFSTFANEQLKVGDVLEAMPPAGRFFDANAQVGGHLLGFAGGSGITPVLSILKTALASDPEARFTLVYANRAMNTIMFREELEDLKNRYLGRLSVIHILEHDAQDIDLFTGRIDAEKCGRLFEHWIDVSSVDRAYICGPEPMMLVIADALEGLGLKKEQIRFELFTSAQQGRAKRQAIAAKALTEKATRLSITLDGATRTVEMAKDQCVLEAALQNALDAPHSCRAGVCSTCRCKILEGEVEMLANHALEDYEVERGYALSCQSYPLTDRLVVSYDDR